MSNPLLNVAVTAARAAGRIIERNANRIESLSITSKQRNDFVSEVDHQAEAEIIRILKRAYPQYGFLAEESGARGNDEARWIIDPLDGTTNYLRRFPHYAVSIAFQRGTTLEVGVIYDPGKEELFTASKGDGAQLDGRRIRVSQLKTLDGALLGTGIPFRAHSNLDRYLETLKTLAEDAAGIRRAGSAALDLAYVAAGRLDGFWEFGLNAWDIAAGALIVQEAGGMVGDMKGGNGYLESGNVLAANLRAFEVMKTKLRPHLA